MWRLPNHIFIFIIVNMKKENKENSNTIFPETPEEARKLLKSFSDRNRNLKIRQDDVSKHTGIRQDHISKLLNGQFKNLNGQALKLCKYAFEQIQEQHINKIKTFNQREIEELSRSLLATVPGSEEKVIHLLKAIKDLIDQAKAY